MRILAVDPGTKNIGLALSDPSGQLARPLKVIPHSSRQGDAACIAAEAVANSVGLILIGLSLDENGMPTLAGRRSTRLTQALREKTDLPVILWDEAFSTQEARRLRISQGAPRKKRMGHLDEVAAAVMLQSYLDQSPLASSA
jgi:putative Holliday junction resolvase